MKARNAQLIHKCGSRIAPAILLMAFMLLLTFSAGAWADDASGGANPPATNPSTAPADNQADSGPANAPSAQRRPLMMLDRLCQSAMKNVTEEQKAKVQAIHDKAAADLREAFADSSLHVTERLEKARQTLADARKQVADALPPEQQKEFLKTTATLEQNARQGAGQQLAELWQTIGKLHLTREQNAKILQAFTNAQMQLIQARQGMKGDAHAMAEKARGILQDFRAQVDKTLTPDQQKQLQDTLAADSPDANGAAETPATSPAITPATMPAEAK